MLHKYWVMISVGTIIILDINECLPQLPMKVIMVVSIYLLNFDMKTKIKALYFVYISIVS